MFEKIVMTETTKIIIEITEMTEMIEIIAIPYT